MAGAKSLVVLCREKMTRAKCLVVLCILLIITISLAAPCKFSICYGGCRALGVSKPFCAKKCHCGLPSTFASNELKMEDYNRAKSVLEEMMMMEDDYNLETAAEMEVDYNLAEAVLEEMKMTEEVISFNDKLTAKCKYNPCYRACRALGGSKGFCANKCRCTQLATDKVPVSPPSGVMAFKFILAVALVSVIIGIILFSRKKTIPISCFIKIWNIFIGIISFLVKKGNKRQEDEKADNKKEVNEEKQSLLPASGTAQVAAQAQDDQGQRSIHSDPNKNLDLQPLVDPETSTAEEDGTLVPAASTPEEEGTLVPASLHE